AGHLLGGVDLRRAVQQAEELRGGIPRDLVVQPFGGLGGEDQAEAVLAGLRRQRQRAPRAGGERAGGGEVLRLVHDEQATERAVGRRVLLDPGEQCHLEL